MKWDYWTIISTPQWFLTALVREINKRNRKENKAMKSSKKR